MTESPSEVKTQRTLPVIIVPSAEKISSEGSLLSTDSAHFRTIESKVKNKRLSGYSMSRGLKSGRQGASH